MNEKHMETILPEETFTARAESLSGGKFKCSVAIADSQREHFTVIQDLVDAFANLHSQMSEVMKDGE
jgi:hypothetical protein